MAVAVVGVLAFGVGVVDDQAEARPGARGGPLQHLQVAVGVAERRDRPAADELVDADGLARAVVDEVDLGQLHRAPACRRRSSNCALDRAADHLLGRDAVGLLGPGPHEVDAAAGDDEGLEAVRAQVGQQLEHRLVDQLGVGPVEARVARGGEPVRRRSASNSSVVMPACVASDDLDDALLAAGRERLHVARRAAALNGSRVASIRDAAAPAPSRGRARTATWK